MKGNDLTVLKDVLPQALGVFIREGGISSITGLLAKKDLIALDEIVSTNLEGSQNIFFLNSKNIRYMNLYFNFSLLHELVIPSLKIISLCL